ncbi:MAG: hypothetical protein H6713_13320 [Myxococcales bacterium]|nr:hypothetical protein [Myxococcales bacterium]
MRHFISFQKKKALYLDDLVGAAAQSTALAHELNHELMAVGFVLAKDAFDAVAALDVPQLEELYRDLIGGIRRIVGGDGHEPIYRNFPQSVLALSYERFAINALLHYWTFGRWRPEDEGHLQREFGVEPVKYKPVGLLSRAAFERIFHDLLYGQVSLSAFDKRCVDWYIDQGGGFDFSRISFKETASYVGQRLLASDARVLPTRRATTVLRIWSAFSGGDEGLKENTRFKSPSARARAVLLRTLEQCDDLEDSFKSYRERWLRLLLYLHPMTEEHRQRYPKVAEYADRLRNKPETLRTFRSRVEAAIEARDPALFALLSRRPGEFMRRLDHLVRVFGVEALHRWLELDTSFAQLVTAYNHFAGRGEAQAGRGAVLAGAGKSEFVTYKALEPLPRALVEHITDQLLERLRRFRVAELAGPVHIDRGLYYAPLATNNRASTLALDSKVIGETRRYTEGATLRMYVHWEGRSDIDLSAFSISRANEVIKVGWNATHQTGYLVYSGDNTGLAEKNAEYLDINTELIPPEIEWIITEARIFRGPDNFAGYNGTAHIGWMSRQKPEANRLWLPKTLEHAMALRNQARTAYLMAYHPRSRNIVYLDMSMGDARVSTPQDAIRMRLFLERFVTIDDGEHETDWRALNQGHVLELLSGELAGDASSAEVAFGEHTTAEQVSRLMTLARDPARPDRG